MAETPPTIDRIRALNHRVLRARDALDCCSRGKSNSSLGISRLMDEIDAAWRNQPRTVYAFIRPLPILLRGTTTVVKPNFLGIFPFEENEGGIITVDDLVEEIKLPETQAELEAMAEFARVAAAVVREKAVEECLKCVEKHLLRQDRPRAYESGTFRIRQS